MSKVDVTLTQDGESVTLVDAFEYIDVGCDPHFSSVESLLHMDGSNGSTTFTDEEGVSWVARGSVQITTTDPKFGNGSMLIAASTDFIDTPKAAWNDFSTTGDYTVEMWINASKAPDKSALFAHRFASGSDDFPLTVAFGKIGTTNATPEMYVGYYNGAWQGAESTFEPTVGTWHHVAVTREGSIITLWVDGTNRASFDQSGSPPTAPQREFRVGTRWDGIGDATFRGQIDDWRVTRGVARYTAAFTPPSTQHPDVTC